MVYKSQSWDLDLRAELGPPGGAPGAPPGSGAAAVGYLGGHQIQWMKQWVGVLNRMPPQVGVVGAGGYGWVV